MIRDLEAVFDALARPAATSNSDGRFNAQVVSGYPRYRIGKDDAGSATLLIQTVEGQGPLPVPVRLENLEVRHGLQCRVSHPNGAQETGRFSIVRCFGDDPTIKRYFLRAVGSMAVSIGPSPTAEQLDRAIQGLVELFSAMAMPARKSIQGLWAELFLIANAAEPEPLLTAWHVIPEERYDFSQGRQRIEVKSAAGRIRRHNFSLEQLNPPGSAQVIIASVLVDSSAGGATIAGLLEMIRQRTASNPELIVQTERMVALTLGDSWASASEDRFDLELAEESLRFFPANEIPSVAPDLPAGVSDVRFVSDLSASAEADVAWLRQSGGLFAAAIPQ